MLPANIYGIELKNIGKELILTMDLQFLSVKILMLFSFKV